MTIDFWLLFSHYSLLIADYWLLTTDVLASKNHIVPHCITPTHTTELIDTMLQTGIGTKRALGIPSWPNIGTQHINGTWSMNSVFACFRAFYLIGYSSPHHKLPIRLVCSHCSSFTKFGKVCLLPLESHQNYCETIWDVERLLMFLSLWDVSRFHKISVYKLMVWTCIWCPRPVFGVLDLYVVSWTFIWCPGPDNRPRHTTQLA